MLGQSDGFFVTFEYIILNSDKNNSSYDLKKYAQEEGGYFRKFMHFVLLTWLVKAKYENIPI